MDELVRVLVVDDSAYVRKVLKQILSRSPFLEVIGTARDGTEALEMVADLQPDVVTLDLVMPRMDGVAFLREQMARRPLPVVVVSVTDANSGQHAARALEAGAVDMVQKPTALATDKIFEIAGELVAKVKAAAEARWPVDVTALPARAVASTREYSGAFDVVVIGVSTGGPQALRYLIPQLPADLPVPIALVLHMPTGYTDMYARSLGEISRLTVTEAREGDSLRPGVVLIAPAGQHLTFRRLPGEGVVAHLDLNPLGLPHRPAVDVLFRSAAEVFGSRVLGVVLSGMGSDGTDGAAWIKSQGGTVFTESEQTCVVYGMPRSVDEAGLSDRSLPLSAVASEFWSHSDGKNPGGRRIRLCRAHLSAAEMPQNLPGHVVLEAEDGISGIECYFLEKPDLVLLDITMKGMNGIEVLQKLREMDPSARVVIATADIQSSTRTLTHTAGACGFVVKPLAADQVLAAVTAALHGGA